MAGESYSFDVNSRYVPISINMKNLRIEELHNQSGTLQARIVTLVVSEQKHLGGQFNKLESWNEKGKLAFLDTLNKTIIYSPTVKEKLRETFQAAAAAGAEAAAGHEPEMEFHFVQQQGEELVDLGWNIAEDNGEVFQQILDQQRSQMASSVTTTETKEHKNTGAVKATGSQPLKGRVREPTPEVKERMSEPLHAANFYLAISQIASNVKEAKREARKEQDQQNRDAAEHTEQVRNRRHEELEKTTIKKDLGKEQAARTKDNKEQQTRVAGTSVDAQKEPPTSANKSAT